MHRIKLEAAQYADNCFLTLTYADDQLPKDGSLEPVHLSLFLKRVRSMVMRSEVFQFRKLRFFAVGEYGDENFRPHYHVMLFNYPSCRHPPTRTPPKYSHCCLACDLIAKVWPYGLVRLDPYSDALGSYIGGYVTKKMTRKDDPRLGGKYPEFARQSLRPGIGAGALHEVADVLLRYYDVASELGDVPSALRHGRAVLPLGRYMRGSLRQMVGMEKNAPQVTLDKMAEEMLAVRLAAKASSENPSISGQVKARDAGKVARTEARHKLFKTRRSL